MILPALLMMIRGVIPRFGQKTNLIPSELQSDFNHLYQDVVWFGIAAGSCLAFLGVYMARLGATPLQMGLLNAGPAITGLLFTMPAGIWLRDKPVGRVVFWSAVAMRGQYLLWAFLPGLFEPLTQIWLIIYSILIFTIPATLNTISFNAMYAAAVPVEYRHHMAATRNALLAVVYVVTSLISGWLLNILPMTLGYTLVFLAGFLGSVMSAYHLFHLRHITTAGVAEPQKVRTNLDDLARAGEIRTTGLIVRTNVGMRVFSRGLNLLRSEVLRGSYGKVVTALFVFHFAQFLPIPVFPLFWVDNAHFTDWEIGLGTALFYLAVFLGSVIFVRVAKYWDNRRWTASSAILMGSYPLLTAYSYNMPMLALTSVVGGLAWSIAATTLGNYLLEKAPEAERPAALAWYNLGLNAAVLIGSLGGSAMAAWIGVVPTLLLATGLRALAGLALWKWH